MSNRRSSSLSPILRPSKLRRSALVASLVVPVCILLAAVLLAPGSQVEGDDSALPLITPAAADAEDSASDDDGLEAIELPVVSYELLLERDPFEPVVPEPEPDPGAGSGNGDEVPGSGVDQDGNGNSGTDGSAGSGSPDPGSGGATGSCVSGPEVVCDGRVITVVEIVEENGELIAVLQIDAMRYRVRPGDVLDVGFEVVSVSADAVRLLIGDRLVSVTVGDNVLK